MIKNYRKINIILFSVLIIISALAAFAILNIKRSNEFMFDVNNNEISKNADLIIYAEPKFNYTLINLVKDYSSKTNAKIQLNFVTQLDLQRINFSLLHNKEILFIGYNQSVQNVIDFHLSEESEKKLMPKYIPIELWRKQFIGVKKKLSLTIKSENIETEGIVFKNLCQLTNVASEKNISIENAKDLSTKELEMIDDKYYSDCIKLCNIVANKMQKREFSINSVRYQYYVELLKDEPINDPEIIDNGKYNEFKFKNLIFYQSLSNNLKNNEENNVKIFNLFDFIAEIENNHDDVIVKNLQDKSDIEFEWINSCKNELIKTNIFTSKGDILLDFFDKIELLSNKNNIIYSSSLFYDVRGECLNIATESDQSMNNFTNCTSFAMFANEILNT